jgi:hypothetical protein
VASIKPGALHTGLRADMTDKEGEALDYAVRLCDSSAEMVETLYQNRTKKAS